jgi:hypothetical protein
MCSDLIAKPFSNNDINLTLMCAGARANTKCDDGEMGAGFPIHYLEQITKGVLITLNLVERNGEKERILAGLDDPLELGFAIETGKGYGANAMKYRRYCDEMEAEEGTYER